MQTSYIYSASKANALGEALLSRTEIERLLIAEPGEELKSALKESYLASYVVRVPEEDVALAIEETLKHAKKLIHRIAPKGDMFRVLWVQYDIHNLRVFSKAAVAGISYDDCKPFLSERGIYAPSYLYEHIEHNTLNNLQISWQEPYNEAVQLAQSGNIGAIDGVFDQLYFDTSRRIVTAVQDPFIHICFQTIIDLYNLKSRLRHLKNDSIDFEPKFIDGGTFPPTAIETLDGLQTMFTRFGGESFWAEALEHYQQTGNFTQIDAKAQDYLLTVARQGSHDMFSSASLVFYYLRCLQAANNIRTIVVGKNSGLDAVAIRPNLRLAYVKE